MGVSRAIPAHRSALFKKLMTEQTRLPILAISGIDLPPKNKNGFQLSAILPRILSCRLERREETPKIWGVKKELCWPPTAWGRRGGEEGGCARRELVLWG